MDILKFNKENVDDNIYGIPIKFKVQHWQQFKKRYLNYNNNGCSISDTQFIIVVVLLYIILVIGKYV